MTGYMFDLSCHRCGGPLVHVNDAHPTSFEAVAVAVCVPCRREYAVRVQLIDLHAERIAQGHERVRNVETRRQLDQMAVA